MKRLMTLAVPIAATLTIAACGNTGSSGSTSSAPGSATSTSTTLAVRQLPGLGSVLVDNTGKALYANNLESASKILCTDPACNAFGTPLTLHAASRPHPQALANSA